MSTSNHIWDHLKEFVTDTTLDSPETSIEAFLIKKTRKRNQLEKFMTHRFQLTDELAQAFRSILEESLQSHGFNIQNSKQPTIKNFSDPSLADSGELYVIKKNTLKELSGLIDDLEMHNDITPIPELDAMAGASLYCFEARLEHNSIFAISRIHNLYRKNDQQLITAEFKNAQMHMVEKNIIQFSKDILCIYLKNFELLLILDSPSTQSKLGFKDQYEAKAKNIISDEWEVVDIPDGREDAVLGNSQYNQMLIKIYYGNRLKNEIEHYNKYNNFCKSHPNLGLEPIDIDNNKLVITKSKHLENALYASDGAIVQGVLEPGEYSIALRRRLLGGHPSRR